MGTIAVVFGTKTQIAQSQKAAAGEEKKDYIKWVEFQVTCEALNQAFAYDIHTYGEEVHLNWVTLLAYLGAKYGGDFSRYQAEDMSEMAALLQSGEKTEQDLRNEMKYYAYYREAYGAVLDGMVGAYELEYPVSETEGAKQPKTTDLQVTETEREQPQKKDSEAAKTKSGQTEITETESKSTTAWKTVYGLKAFHPIAKGFPYSDYDDFGASRSYGYKRNHLGHDMMGQVGTPIIAVESGYVSQLGWNQYGGWRIGINSFDGRRYYYYAHLRQNRPFAEGLELGALVQAGDVIGYLGRTGYSKTENVNNIDQYHLHFGLQLIFDESQREGSNQIWVSGYELVKFLYQHQSEVKRNDETKEWSRVYQIKDAAVPAYE